MPSRVNPAATDAGRAKTAAARAAVERNSAIRALDDPVELARAARIIRAALDRQMISLDDLVPGGEQSQQAS